MRNLNGRAMKQQLKDTTRGEVMVLLLTPHSSLLTSLQP